MKKIFLAVVALSILMMGSVSASPHNWGHYGNDRNWHHSYHNDDRDEHGMPFGWHERYNAVREHQRLERIREAEWDHRFPGLHAYRWYGNQGFWHHGHYVTDAVLFFDDNDELVSIGYMNDNVFINIRDDHETYENRDSFFFSWWHHR